VAWTFDLGASLNTREQGWRASCAATLSDGAPPLEGDEILIATRPAGRRPTIWASRRSGCWAGEHLDVDGTACRSPACRGSMRIGDVNGRSLLTHMGKRQAHLLSEILDGRTRGGDRRPTGPVSAGDLPPNPQVAAVGAVVAGGE